ncbi:hypothetical protein D1151_04715 [Emergencia sp. 1XD21-10]|nr:hypothetical protein [Emergencia sp. 1XD21-10]
MNNDIQITISTILALFGALAVVAGGVKVIMQLCSPFRRLIERITECEKRLDAHDTFLGNDKQEITDIKELTRENMRVNLALLNHFIDGNGVEKMKELREEIQDRIF